jgi:putative transposase
MRCFAYCLMPNHFHFVLRPFEDGDLSKFMFRFTTAHRQMVATVSRYRGDRSRLSGEIQGHPGFHRRALLPGLPVTWSATHFRAGLVKRAEEWPWSSLFQREGQHRPLVLSEWPLPRPASWLEIVHAEGLEVSEIEEIRTAIRRNAPLGPELWRKMVAERLKDAKNQSGLSADRKRERRRDVIFFPAP